MKLKEIKISVFLSIALVMAPFLTWAQAGDSTLVPAACYNFIDNFNNDNGETGVEPLIPEDGVGTFVDSDSICLGGFNKHYNMPAEAGLTVDNGSLITQDEYTIELLFKIESIPPENQTDRLFIMNFFNQNGAGLFIDDDGIIKYFDQNDNILAAGVTTVDGFPDDLPTDWVNLAFSLSNDTLTVYYNGVEQFQYVDNDFVLRNNTTYFYPPTKMRGNGKENPIAEVTIDYIRYFDQVLDATSIQSLNLAAIAGQNIEIIASDTVGCIGDIITLTASGGARDYYIWSTGDTTATEVFDFTIVNPVDTVWVQGVAVSPCERRCFDVADTIVIYGNPLPEMDIVGPTEVCELEAATFTSGANPASISSYAWTTTGSVSSQSGQNTKDFTVVFDVEGTVDVNLALTNIYGCIKDTTISILVKKVPTTTVTAPLGACEGEIVNILYTGDAGATANFTWDFDGGVIDAENIADRDFDLHWDTLGTKTIYFEIEENNCLVSGSFIIEISKRPTISLSAPDTICAFEEIEISYNGNAEATTVFDWVFSDADASFAGPDTVKTGTWTTAGIKEVILTLDEGGCTRSDTINVRVLPVPTSSLTAPASICFGSVAAIEYTGTASAGAQLVWNLDGGVRSNEASVDRVFDISWSTIGTKEITLSIDQDNCVKDTTFFIEVARTPTADFDLPASACSDAPVRILYTGDADLSAASLVFDWNFDGGIATPVAGGQEAYDVVWPVEATMPATKTVTLMVTENGCPSTLVSHDIIINRTPIISFTPAIPASICLNQAVTATFDGDAGSAGVFTWDFGAAPDGATNAGTDTNLNLSWTTPGTKTISLAIDNNGCITTQDFTIEVVAIPTLAVSFSATVCEGEYTRITYIGTADVNTANFVWDFDGADAVINLNDESYDVKWLNFDEVTAANNTKTIDLAITQNGCTVSTSFNIEVLQKPNPIISSAAAVCVNTVLPITFDSSPATGVSFTIGQSSGGTIANTADPKIKNISWASPGIKTIEATFSLGGCDSTVSHTVEVFAEPSTNVQGPTEICDNELAVFEYVGNGGAFTAVEWSINPSAGVSPATETGTTYTIDFPVVASPTVYTVTAVIQNGAAPNGCSQTVVRNITVNPAPISTIPNPGAVCSTESVVFDLSADFNASHTYSWNWDGATVENNSGTGTWTVNWPTDGVKNIALTVQSAAGCVSSDALAVTVSPIPVLDINIPTNACTGTDNTISVNNFDPTFIYDLSWAAGDEPDANPDGTTGTNGVWDQLQWTSAPPNGGFKSATLSITTPAGCSIDTTFILQVNNFPEFTVSSSNTCTGIPVLVEFIGAIESGLVIVWDFDGGVATQIPGTDNYNVYWNTIGIVPPKTITATVIGSVCGDADFTVDVVVNQGSDPIYTEPFGTSICLNDAYQVNVTDGGSGGPFNLSNITTLPAGDGVTVNGFTAGGAPPQNISIDGWTEGGFKQVIIEIQDAASLCPIRTDTLAYEVFNYSEITLSATATCINGTVEAYFSGVIGGGASLAWVFEGVLGTDYTIVSGAGTEADPYLVQYLTVDAVDGDWNITANITGGSCDPVSATEAVTVSPPAITVLDVADNEVCEGELANFEYLLSNFSTLGDPLNSFVIKFLNAPISQASTTDATTIAYTASWNTPGVKNYRVIVNNGGCVDSVDYQITVNEIPIANFTQSDNVICLGEQIDFTFNGNFPSADINDIIWDFNGEGVAVGQTPSFTFASIGSKVITVTVNNGACQATFNRTVTVVALPDFSLDIPANICANVPFEVTVINNNAAPMTDFNFSWSFGAATVNPLGSEVYELLNSTAGPDNISVVITNNAGCPITLTQAITINPAPENDFVFDNEVCANDVANFEYTGATTGAAVVTWDFGNAVANGLNATNTWAVPGTKIINVTVSDNTSCVLTTTLEVEIIPNPTNDITAPSEACLNTNFTISYDGTADPVVDQFTWTFSDLANATISKIAGQQTYNVSYASLGTKTVTINVVAAGCPISIMHEIEILPTPDFTVALSDVCTDEAITFYTGTSTVVNIDPGSGGTWINSGGTTVNNIVWDTQGTKTVVLTLSEGNCIETQSFNINVDPTPAGVITPSNGCAGEAILVTYGGSGAASIYADYDWGTSFDAASSVSKLAGQEAYEVVWDVPGTYNLGVQVTEDGCTNFISLPTITISEIPVADFELQATICSLTELTIEVTNPVSGYVYDWDLGVDGEIVAANADNSRIIANWNSSGDKTVTLFTTLGGCTVSADEVIRVLEAANPSFDTPFFCFDDVTGQAIGTITYTGGSDIASTTFDWDFGIDAANGESATLIPGTQNHDVVYTTTGFKVISLTVSNPQCGERTYIDSIAVNNLAEFTFDAVNNALCQGATATFTFTGAYEPGATLSWDFDLGPGDDSTEVAVDSIYQIAYNNPGLKTITLQINGVNCGDSYFTDTFNVGEAPISSFKLGSTENCLGDTTSVTFTGTATSTAILTWDFADGEETVVNDSTFTVVWPTPGAKNISLFIEDGGCLSDTTVQTVFVYDNTDLSLYIDNNLCIDSTGLIIIDTTFLERNATWSWTFNDDAQIISDQNNSTQIEFSYPTSGQKSIRFQVFGDICEGFDTTMLVNVGELVPFDIAADTEICSNDSSRIVFNLPMVTGRTLNWDFGAGSSFTKISATREDYYVKWDTAGVKTVLVSINNGGCILDSSFQVNVTQLPDATFQLSNELCQGDTLFATPDWATSPFTRVRWDYNYNGITGTQTTKEFVLAMPDVGTLQLRLSVTENGCRDSYSASAEIELTPLAAISAPDLICLEGTAIVSFSEDLLAGATYDWGFDSAQIVNALGNESYELGWEVGGDKTLWVVATLGGCSSDTAFHNMNVFSVDNLEVSADTICQHQTLTVNFIEESVENAGFSWSFPGAELVSGDLNSLEDIVLFYPEPGNYEVTLNINGFICNTNQLTKYVQVEPSVIPSLSLEIPPLVCRNTDIDLTLNSMNGGEFATYEYFINNVSIGDEFDNTLLNDQDVIKVVMTTSAPCSIFPTASSNELVANISNYNYTGVTYANPSPVCIGDPTTLSLDPGNYRILDWESSENLQDWESEGSTAPEYTSTLNESTYFRAVLLDSDGICTVTSPPVLAEVVPYNPIDAGNDRNIREGYSVVLEATNGKDFIWKNDLSIETDTRNAKIQVRPLLTTTYVVEGLTLEGCPDMDSVRVIVRPVIAPPNVFTPNADGINDTWLIDQIGPYPSAEVAVYNRWGKKLFESIGYKEPWNGVFNGQVVTAGVYYYVIDLKDGYEAVTGTVTVLY